MKVVNIILINLMLVCIASVAFADTGLPSEEEALEFLEDNLPEAAIEFRQQRSEEPVTYRENILGVRETLKRYYEVKEEEPALADRLLEARLMEYRSIQLAKRINDVSDPDERQQLLGELSPMIEQIFDARIQGRTYELRKLQKKVESALKDLEARKTRKNEIVKYRIDELVKSKEDKSLAWW